jgi:hypothetical protein
MENDRNAQRRAHRAGNLEWYRKLEAAQRNKNRVRYNQTRDDWKKRNPEKRRFISLKLKFGITKEEFDAQLEAQHHMCVVCSEEGVLWHCDHDHVTGRLRGIVCRACNTGLAMFRDDPRKMEAAAAYIRCFNSAMGVD